MQEVKKVEIVVDAYHVDRVLDILDHVQVSGYTLIKDTDGKGDKGIACSDLDCLFSNNYIMTVCTNDEQLNALVTELTPLLKKFGGICLVTPAKWVVH